MANTEIIFCQENGPRLNSKLGLYDEASLNLLHVLEAIIESVLEKGGKERSEINWVEVYEMSKPSISRQNYMGSIHWLAQILRDLYFQTPF